jgi:peptide methionine sulfoxide reductase msrA/msrB
MHTLFVVIQTAMLLLSCQADAQQNIERNNMYFKAIDPTSINQQGHDTGTQYRTGVYYTDSTDEATISRVFDEEQKHIQGKIVVENLPLKNFYKAEDYHQDYLDKNPDGYCHLPQSLFEFARKAKDTEK